MNAVDPEAIEKSSEYLSTSGILDRLSNLEYVPWVTLTGGDPAIWELEYLVSRLRKEWMVGVETQGAVWKDWLRECDLVVVSPKAPSSGEGPDMDVLETYFDNLQKNRVAIQVTIADDTDFEFASEIVRRWPWARAAFHPVTPVDNKFGREEMLSRLGWLADRVATNEKLKHVTVQPHMRGLLGTGS